MPWPALDRRSGAAIGAAAAAVVALSLVSALWPAHGERAYAYPYASRRPAPALRGRPPITAGLIAAAPAPALSPLPSVVAFEALTPQQALAANQALPVSTLPNPAAKPFRMTGVADEDRVRAETCLTQAVYYEAGFEPLAGAQAVAQVVLNRLRHPVFPKTVCGVVFQGADLKTGCQFTFTCDGSMARPPESGAWARAQAVAKAALNGFVMKPVGEATHYHTQWVVPYWSPALIKLTQVGAHIFYRWTGTFGQPPAFQGRYAGDEPAAGTQLASLTPTPPIAAPDAQAMVAAPEPVAPPPRIESAPQADVAQFAPPPTIQASVAAVGKIQPPAPDYFGPPRPHKS